MDNVECASCLNNMTESLVCTRINDEAIVKKSF